MLTLTEIDEVPDGAADVPDLVPGDSSDDDTIHALSLAEHGDSSDDETAHINALSLPEQEDTTDPLIKAYPRGTVPPEEDVDAVLQSRSTPAPQGTTVGSGPMGPVNADPRSNDQVPLGMGPLSRDEH